ncbi:MAG: efflux RND transporter periplasmic adaptor subunit [Rubrivivax sp.]|nr:efflux RND transporter periplasmic adaptor subunit [Rubrivivax sp.]
MTFRLPRRHALAAASAAVLLGATTLGLLATRHETALAAERPASATAATPPTAATVALSVSVTTPLQQPLARTVAASGSIVARDELIVGSDAAGVRLVQVLVEAGSVVKRGQLLARGDDAQLQAQLAQADAQQRQAEAELAQAQANLKRAEDVQDAGVFSDEAVLARRTAVATLAARRDLVRAQRRELEVKLAQTQVRAPADGVVSRSAATTGAVMQPGLELFRIIREGQLEWQAELPAAALARVQPGATARLLLADSRRIEAPVRLVAPTLDARTRNGLVHVLLPRDAALRAGAHASGEIVLGSAPAWTVPESSVIQRDGRPHVWQLDADDVAHLVPIETGARHGGRVEVIGGLQPGRRIVATGAGFVKDGERVRVAAAPTPAPEQRT